MPLGKISYPSPRVSQLDASILDDEIFSLLKQQLSDASSLVSNQPWSYNSHPELWSLILKLVIFKLTTFNTGSSYGFKIQNLKLSDAKSGAVIGKRLRYLLLGTILGEYAVKKAQSYLFAMEESSLHPRNLIERIKGALFRHRSRIIKISADSVQVLELLNFLSFLVFGRYPNLIYRALGISVTPVVADLLKFNGSNVNFEFQNRQLVWNVMTEFLVFILPLLQLRKLRRMVRGLMPKKDDAYHFGYSEKPLVTNFTSLPVSQCAMCIETIEVRGTKAASTLVTNPCVTNCNHIFCYVCLAIRFNAIENGNESAEGCPRCRMKITYFRQYGLEPGDVDTDAIMVKYEEVGSDDSGNSDEEFEDALQSKESLGEASDATEENSDESSVSSESPPPSYSENEDLEEEAEYSDYLENGDENEDFDDEDDDVDVDVDGMF